MNHQPLVTVRVLTYNSSRFLIEALESVKNQTYKNIELVISDDCSTDNSVEISRKWLSENKERFVRSEVLTVEKNTGVSANCNRTISWAQGEWLGGVAGDDILLPTAIEEFVNYVSEHHDAHVVVGGTIKIDEDSKEIHEGKSCLTPPFYYADNYSAKKQFNLITKCFFACGPSTFVSLKAIKAVGGYDERFPMLEDYPIYIKLTHAGYHMNWLGKHTLKYRISESSISHSRDNDDAIFGKGRIRSIKEYKFLYKREYLDWLWRRFLDLDIFLQNQVVDSGNSRNSPKTVVYYKLYRLLSPFAWVERKLFKN